MISSASRIIVNRFAAGQPRGDVEALLTELFPASIIELRDTGLPEPLILEVRFTGEQGEIDQGEEVAIEVERRLFEAING